MKADMISPVFTGIYKDKHLNQYPKFMLIAILTDPKIYSFNSFDGKVEEHEVTIPEDIKVEAKKQLIKRFGKNWMHKPCEKSFDKKEFEVLAKLTLKMEEMKNESKSKYMCSSP